MARATFHPPLIPGSLLSLLFLLTLISIQTEPIVAKTVDEIRNDIALLMKALREHIQTSGPVTYNGSAVDSLKVDCLFFSTNLV